MIIRINITLHFRNILHIYFDRNDVYGSIDVNDTDRSKECNIYQYWHFSINAFKFQIYVCNRCHDLLMKSMDLSDIAIESIKGTDYYCIIS